MVHLGASEIAKFVSGDIVIYNFVAVAITLGLAAMLYFVIEQPALMLKRQLPPGAAGPYPALLTIGAVSIGLIYHLVLSLGLTAEQLDKLASIF
jgi:peptidoglycan/LPS O-acetylase OafA/YrhL